MFIGNSVTCIFEVARAIMRESPGISPELALLLAQYIYKTRRKYMEN